MLVERVPAALVLDPGGRIGRGCNEPDSGEIRLLHNPHSPIPGFLRRKKFD